MYANQNKFHLRQINNVCFSPNGSKVVSTGMDDDNSLAVYDWKNKSIVSTSKVDKNKVEFMNSR